MKVKMLRNVLYENKVFELGKEYEVDYETAERWIKHNIAEPTEEIFGKVEIKKGKKK